MRHHIMYTFVIQGIRNIKVMDFQEGRILTISSAELETNLLYKELAGDLAPFIEKINQGGYDYHPPKGKK
ncbi:hypothetical protein CEF21_09955 [Bacillus sp. FJAT-42376]|uniref:hypothetical protein n=1 Tax=Bacillus sp. FJAT-42376 TaxID=2014076 RepID=UPI000F4D87C4|nr:hypothetical protein [Bacillus sp. FJAT-42376]AZB42584.1 hypothetical protein CEF21_09955 [Bacillus sp. FJAT-42376]